MMSKEERIERIERRIERLKAFAKGKDFSLFSEERSGIPLGQPILVGHHSEKRHRRHLERLNRLCQQGYDAQKRIEQLKERIEAIKHNKAIYSDDPDAIENLKKKLETLQRSQDHYKKLNSLVRKSKNDREVLATLLNDKLLAEKLLTPDFAGRIGIPSYVLQNNNANMRRIKERIKDLEKLESTEFRDFSINGVDVKLVDSQIQVHFPFKPSEEIRTKLKRSPLALKWSRYSMAWVRKFTPSINNQRFIGELKDVISQIST